VNHPRAGHAHVSVLQAAADAIASWCSLVNRQLHYGSFSGYDALYVSASHGKSAEGHLIGQALAPLETVAAVSQGLSLHRSR
jgi:hypothetical protein